MLANIDPLERPERALNKTHIDWRVLRVLQKRRLSDWPAKILANQKIYIFLYQSNMYGSRMYVVQYSSTNLKRWYQRTQTLANIGPLERPNSSQNFVRDAPAAWVGYGDSAVTRTFFYINHSFMTIYRTYFAKLTDRKDPAIDAKLTS